MTTPFVFNQFKHLHWLLLGFIWPLLGLSLLISCSAENTAQKITEKSPVNSTENSALRRSWHNHRTPASETTNEVRIVSLDFCADQYVVKLAAHNTVAALSPHSQAPFSYVRQQAERFPQVRPRLEDVLSLKPTIVIRSYGGGPQISQFLTQLGIVVVQLPFTDSIEDIYRTIDQVAQALSQPAQGRQLQYELQSALNQVPPATTPALSALYITPSGATPGTQGLIHELLTKTGFRNYSHAKGWRPLPLERLVREQPDAVATAFFEQGASALHFWSAAQHPVLAQQLNTTPTIELSSAWIACGGWFLADAVQALGHLRQQIEHTH